MTHVPQQTQGSPKSPSITAIQIQYFPIKRTLLFVIAKIHLIPAFPFEFQIQNTQELNSSQKIMSGKPIQKEIAEIRNHHQHCIEYSQAPNGHHFLQCRHQNSRKMTRSPRI